MELPFLKNKQKDQGGGVTERDSESASDSKLLGMIAEELLEAFDKKDRAGFRQALRAFVRMIREQDEVQDAASAR